MDGSEALSASDASAPPCRAARVDMCPRRRPARASMVPRRSACCTQLRPPRPRRLACAPRAPRSPPTTRPSAAAAFSRLTRSLGASSARSTSARAAALLAAAAEAGAALRLARAQLRARRPTDAALRRRAPIESRRRVANVDRDAASRAELERRAPRGEAACSAAATSEHGNSSRSRAGQALAHAGRIRRARLWRRGPPRRHALRQKGDAQSWARAARVCGRARRPARPGDDPPNTSTLLLRPCPPRGDEDAVAPPARRRRDV